MMKTIKRTLLLSILLSSLFVFYIFWLPAKMFANSIITTDYITSSIMNDIRNELQEQSTFRDKVAAHHGPAKRYLHRTPLTVFTTLELGMYDVYATYINAKGEWVVRMGVYPDKNAETFFSEQIGGFYGQLLGYTMKMLNSLIDLGIFKPMLYHVTNNPETSFASPNYESVPGLVK